MNGLNANSDSGSHPATPPPAPVAPSDATSDALIPSQPTPNYEQPTLHPESTLHRVADTLGTILGGPTTVKLASQPDGSLKIVPSASTTGEKWGRILQAALGGLAAGESAAGTGPGSMTRAVGASVNAGLKMPQQRMDQLHGEMDEAQKTQLHNAQLALLGTQNAEASFSLSRAKTQAVTGFLESQNQMHDLIVSNANNHMVGNIATTADLPKLKETDPNVVKDFYAGKVKLLAHVNPDGTYGGIDVYHVEPDWQKQMNASPIERKVLAPGDKLGDPPKLTTMTLPANSISNGDYLKVHAADEKAILDYGIEQQKDAEQKLNDKAIRTAHYAAADKDRAQADQARALPGGPETAGLSGDPLLAKIAQTDPGTAALVKQIGSYNQDLKTLGFRGNDRTRFMKLVAQVYPQLADGTGGFDEKKYQTLQKAQKDFATGTQGTQIQTFNQFLGHAENLSNTINHFRTTGSPLINVPLKNLRKAMGDAQYAQIEPQIDLVRTEYKNFLNNNHALHLSDVEEGKDLLNDNMSLAQMQAGMKEFARGSITRVGTLNDMHRRVVGRDVPELLNSTSQRTISDFGLAPYAQSVLGSGWGGRPAAATPGQAPAGAIGKVPGTDGKLHWTDGKVDLGVAE